MIPVPASTTPGGAVAPEMLAETPAKATTLAPVATRDAAEAVGCVARAALSAAVPAAATVVVVDPEAGEAVLLLNRANKPERKIQ